MPLSESEIKRVPWSHLDPNGEPIEGVVRVWDSQDHYNVDDTGSLVWKRAEYYPNRMLLAFGACGSTDLAKIVSFEDKRLELSASSIGKFRQATRDVLESLSTVDANTQATKGIIIVEDAVRIFSKLGEQSTDIADALAVLRKKLINANTVQLPIIIEDQCEYLSLMGVETIRYRDLVVRTQDYKIFRKWYIYQVLDQSYNLPLARLYRDEGVVAP